MRKILSDAKNHKYIFAVALFGCSLLLVGRYYVTGSLIGGDAVRYYMSLRSVVIDRNIDVLNEHRYFARQVSPYTGFAKVEKPPEPKAGWVGPFYAVGNAILLAPFLVVGHLLTLAARAVGFSLPADGYGGIYQISAALGSMIYAFGGVIFMYQLGKKLFSAEIALVGSLAIWLATPLVYYMTMEPLMSHALSVFCLSAFIYLWYVTRSDRNTYQWVALGLIGGLAALVRPQDSLFLLFPVADHLVSVWREPAKRAAWGRSVLNIGLCAVAAISVNSIQLYINQAERGSIIAYAFPSAFPFWNAPRLFYTLFSVDVGLILMAPIMLFALVGLAMFAVKNRPTGTFLALAFLAQWYVVSSWADPTQGHSFGNRVLLDSSIIFAVGLMYLLSRLQKEKRLPAYAIGICAGFILLNGLLAGLYVFRIIGPAYGTSAVLG